MWCTTSHTFRSSRRYTLVALLTSTCGMGYHLCNVIPRLRGRSLLWSITSIIVGLLYENSDKCQLIQWSLCMLRPGTCESYWKKCYWIQYSWYWNVNFSITGSCFLKLHNVSTSQLEALVTWNITWPRLLVERSKRCEVSRNTIQSEWKIHISIRESYFKNVLQNTMSCMWLVLFYVSRTLPRFSKGQGAIWKGHI